MAHDLTRDQAHALQTRLRALELRLPQQLATSESGGRPVELDQQSVGRLSRIDAIAQQSVNKANLNRLRLRLGQVRAALRRIEEGEYGYCVICEEPIGFRRLSVVPEVTTCVSCQERREQS